MASKEETSTYSRMTFYSQQSHLRRSAITKHSETPDPSSIKDSYRIYILGPNKADKPRLIQTLQWAINNKPTPLKYLKQGAVENVVELTPNRQYQVTSNTGHKIQLRRGTHLIEPTLSLSLENSGYYQGLFQDRCVFPFCSPRQKSGDAVIVTMRLGMALTSEEKQYMKTVIVNAKHKKMGVYVILTHLDTFAKEIRNIKDAERMQRSILSVSKEFGVERERVLILQCYREKEARLSEEINFYALQVFEEVIASCCENDVEKPKSWFCDWFS